MDLINDILDISKIEAGKMTVEIIACDPARTVVEVASMLRPRAMENNLPLTIEFVGLIPGEIKTDAVRLKQVLMNLVGNAIKFTRAGEVRVRMSADCSGATSRIQFEVIDTGIGMTPQQMARLFQPFVQADESMTRKYGGSGLGLVIRQRLVAFRGGSLSLRSQFGQGSTFKFVIDGGPVAGITMREGLTESMLGVASHTSDAAQIELNARILLVEDGPDNQRLLTIYLTMAGAQVVVAENGRVAIERVRAESFDLVLMDMQMPVLDGYSATSELRRLGFTLPIVALTAHAMSSDRARCLQAGCTDYLTKPIEQELLLRTIAVHLKREAAPATSHAAPARDHAEPILPGVVQGAPATSPPSQAVVRRVRNNAGIAAAMKQATAEFVAALPSKVDELRSFEAAGDLQELHRLTHQLKGAGAGYGFSKISELAALAEVSLKTAADCETIRRTVEELIALIQSIDGYDAAREKPLNRTVALQDQTGPQ